MTDVSDASNLIQDDMDPDNGGNQLLWEDKISSSDLSFTYSFLDDALGLPSYYGSDSNFIGSFLKS